MGKGGWQRHLVVNFFTCLKYAKNKREEGRGGEVVDISHNFFGCMMLVTTKFSVWGYGCRKVKLNPIKNFF